MNYGVALHLNGISDSSAASASESVVQSFDEESAVHSDDESSNKRMHNLVLVTVAGFNAIGAGDTAKYGVETMWMVLSPFMSRIGEKVD